MGTDAVNGLHAAKSKAVLPVGSLPVQAGRGGTGRFRFMKNPDAIAPESPDRFRQPAIIPVIPRAGFFESGRLDPGEGETRRCSAGNHVPERVQVERGIKAGLKIMSRKEQAPF